MSEFNQELVKRLAMGDETAYKEIEGLPTPLKMSIGNAVDKLRREENIIPSNSGLSIYEQKKGSYSNDEEVGKALANRLQIEKENREKQEKIRQENLEKEAKQRADRARALGSWQ
jgi:hypothetical protein